MSGIRSRIARHEPGFTLIELLVVISIITLLIAILLPAIAQAEKLAKRTQCASRIRQAMIAMQNYRQDADGSLPGPRMNGNTRNTDALTAPERWGPADYQQGMGAVDLKYYAESFDAFNCPEGSRKEVKMNAYGVEGNATFSFQMITDYAYLAGLGGDVSGWSSPGGSATPIPGAVPLQMARASAMPSDMAVIADLAYVQPGQQGDSKPLAYQVGGDQNKGSGFNHLYGANAAFGDGHVTWHEIDDLDYVADNGNIVASLADGLLPPAPASGYYP